MKYIYIGKIVNTHGIKGELKLLSDFEYKNLIFKKDFKLYIGTFKEEKIIKTYRKHKNFDMILFDEYTNINEVLHLLNESVYIKSDSIQIDGYFIEELINLEVYDNKKYIGKIISVEQSKAHKLFLLDTKIRIPYIKEFVKKIDLSNHKVEVQLIKGFINENWYNNTISRLL